MFIDPAGDHYRTRMTHTLETTAISRVVARALRLNEDHRGDRARARHGAHALRARGGEDALDDVPERFGSRFRHNEHSHRIARSLNLTTRPATASSRSTGEREPGTLEGKIVRLVDRVDDQPRHRRRRALRASLRGRPPARGDRDPRLDRLRADRPARARIVDSSEGVDDVRQSAEVGEA